MQNIFDRSEKEQNDFDVAMQQHQNDPLSDLPLEVQDKVDTSHVNPEFLEDVHTLKLPKFCLKVQPSLFSLYDSEELSKENLLSNFTLKENPAQSTSAIWTTIWRRSIWKTAIPRHRVSPS